MFPKFDLTALQNFLTLHQIFLPRASTNSHEYFASVAFWCEWKNGILLRNLDVWELVLLNVQFNFFITQPKNKQLLNALDTIWIRRRLQCEGGHGHIFSFRKTITRAKQHLTNYYCAVFYVIRTMLCMIKQYFIFCSALFVFILILDKRIIRLIA